MLKIAVLCSGGDSQGMNTCIQTIATMVNITIKTTSWICIFRRKKEIIKERDIESCL